MQSGPSGETFSVAARLLLVGVLFLVSVAVPTAIGAEVNKDAVSMAKQSSHSKLSDGWYLVRTTSPLGGPDAISIMRTADPSRSDLDLAGLTIRCSSGGPEALIITLRPFSFGARPIIVFGKSGHEARFRATVAPPSTAVLVPMDATKLVTVSRQTPNDLFVRIEDSKYKLRGVISLAGLQSALKVLMENCPAQ
jgi:hypothetical protein